MKEKLNLVVGRMLLVIMLLASIGLGVLIVKLPVSRIPLFFHIISGEVWVTCSKWIGLLNPAVYLLIILSVFKASWKDADVSSTLSFFSPLIVYMIFNYVFFLSIYFTGSVGTWYVPVNMLVIGGLLIAILVVYELSDDDRVSVPLTCSGLVFLIGAVVILLIRLIRWIF